MLNRFEQLWNGIRWVVLGRESTLSEPTKPIGGRRWVMMFSLVASILVWLVLSLLEDYSLSVEYITCAVESQEINSVCISGLEDDSVLAQPLPETIRATLYGPGINLIVQRFRARYRSSPITFDSNQGILETQLLLRIPEEVDVESIVPQTIDMRKEARTERLIPIKSRVVFVSQPPYFFTGEPKLTPDSVRVSGPVSVISQLVSWPTRSDTTISISGAVEYQVGLADSLAGLVRLGINETTVTQLASQYTEGQNERVRVEIEGIPNASSAVQLDPESVTITYQVPLSKFSQAYQSPQIRALVSYAQIYDDTTGRVVPRVEFPSDLMLREVTVSPGRLRYFINIGSQ